jgi:transcriptional regulator GlxA family with amidase domain
MRHSAFYTTVVPHGRTQRITEAIYFLRDDVARPLRVEQLADTAQMSPSSFYQHFKLLTSLTPIQYQKQLRRGTSADGRRWSQRNVRRLSSGA